MERVVYILGAGFSAPHGLPVVRNFIEKAKDLFAREPGKYAHFVDAFKVIDEYSKIKNLFKSDLLNVEEVLSLVETRSQLLGEVFPNTFERFINDVVRAYTYPVGDKPAGPGGAPSSWPNFWNDSGGWRGYLNFVASLFQLEARVHNGGASVVRRRCDVQYDVVTLNYDTLLEDCASFIADAVDARDGTIRFARPGDDQQAGSVSLSKIHGTVGGRIVPPTWAKAPRPEILREWQAAYLVISKANHIRVIGYSLPRADAYVHYLLKAAAADIAHLKTFDVITIDGDGSTRGRYDALLEFHNYRFANEPVQSCLYRLQPQAIDDQRSFNALERAHAACMSKA